MRFQQAALRPPAFMHHRLARSILGVTSALFMLLVLSAGMTEVRAAIAPPASTDPADFNYQFESVVAADHAKFLWTSPQPTVGEVVYGTSSADLESTGDTPRSREHAIALTGLVPSTVYYYQLRTLAPADQVSVTPVYTFTTPGARTPE